MIGGIETHCEQLYPRLQRLAPELEVTLLIRQGYTDKKTFRFRGVDVRTIWSPVVWGVDTLVHTVLAILYARLFLHPRIMHLHGIGPAVFTPLSRALGFITVVTHHAQDYERPKWGFQGRAVLRLGEFAAARFASAVICVSASLRDGFLQRYPWAARRTSVIRNGGALPEAGGRDGSVLGELGLFDRGYVLAVGRLEATKGFDVLIDAFEHADPAGLKLVIVGFAPGHDEWADRLKTRASEKIVFAGFRTRGELRRLYESAALFVHPSYMEGYGLVVAEALAAEAPVILSDIPPHREFKLGNACYFPRGDVEALAQMLRAPDYAVYRRGSANARERLSSWEDAAEAHLALYRRLLGP